MLNKDKKLNDAQLDNVSGGSHYSNSDLAANWKSMYGKRMILSCGITCSKTANCYFHSYDESTCTLYVYTDNTADQRAVEACGCEYTNYIYKSVDGIPNSHIFRVDYSRSTCTYIDDYK